MRHFKLKSFQRWLKKSELEDNDLVKSLANLKDEKSVSDLGSNLFKVRVSYGSKGKSSGYRTIIAYQEGNKSVFLVGYAKNEQANVSKSELKDLKDLGKLLLQYTSEQIEVACASKVLIELEVKDEIKN